MVQEQQGSQEHGQAVPKLQKGQVDTSLCPWRNPLIQFGELIKGLLIVKDGEEDGNNLHYGQARRSTTRTCWRNHRPI